MALLTTALLTTALLTTAAPEYSPLLEAIPLRLLRRHRGAVTEDRGAVRHEQGQVRGLHCLHVLEGAAKQHA